MDRIEQDRIGEDSLKYHWVAKIQGLDNQSL